MSGWLSEDKPSTKTKMELPERKEEKPRLLTGRSVVHMVVTGLDLQSTLEKQIDKFRAKETRDKR